MVSRLICDPLRCLAGINQSHGRDPEGAHASVMSPIVLIVHGVRDVDQADELFRLIKRLKRGTFEYLKRISTVVITDSKLLRHVADRNPDILAYTHSSYISDAGSVIYSGKQYSSLLLEEVRI
jgi:hypothetical protein